MPQKSAAPSKTRFAAMEGSDRAWTEFAALPTVLTMGHEIYDPVWRRRHTPAHSELTHVVRGTVEVVVGRTRCTMKPGDTLVLPPQVPHRDCFDLAHGLQTFLAFFDWSPHRAFFKRVSPRAMQALSPSGKTDVARIVQQLRDDGGDGGPMSQLVAGARVFEILAVFLREVSEKGRRQGGGEDSPGQARRRALMRSAKRYLQEHYGEPLSLEDIAQSLHVSPFYLSHVFSRESDFTLFGFLTRLRMEKARELLAHSGLKIAAVARSVGYENANYFAKVFRRHCGCLPSEFRQLSNKVP